MQYIGPKVQSGFRSWVNASRSVLARGAVWLLAFAAVFPPFSPAPAGAAGSAEVTYELVSVSTTDAQPNAASNSPSMSPDGRFVAYISYASDLVAGDTNGLADIFVYDRQTRRTTRASVTASGEELDGDSSHAFISADGRYVMFYTASAKLGTPYGGMFFKDLQTGSLRRIDVSQNNTAPPGGSSPLAMTPDGRYALFFSYSENTLVPGVNAAIFRKDIQTGALDVVSLAAGGGGLTGNKCSSSGQVTGAMSADGRYIAFAGCWSNLAPGDSGDGNNLYLRDMQAATVRTISNPSPSQGAAGVSAFPSLSADGRYLVFQSNATDIVPGTTTLAARAYMWDRESNGYSLLSVADSPAWKPSISGNGRYVAYFTGGGATVLDREVSTHVTFSAEASLPMSLTADGHSATVTDDGLNHGGPNMQNVYVVSLGAVPDPVPPLVAIPGDRPGVPHTPYPYAAGWITVDPYPPVLGQPATVGVILQNPTGTDAQVVSAEFYVATFGAGVRWDPIGSVKNVTIPAATIGNPGQVHPTISWTPPFDGHHCVQVRLTLADGRQQTVQRNIDILGISTGGSVSGPGTIGNPTPTTATIDLKVVPVAMQPHGWTATLDRTSLTLAPGALDNVNLTITPPVGAPAGSYATYNVEAYVGSQLIGGFSRTVVIGGLAAPTVSNPTVDQPQSLSFVITGTALPDATVTLRIQGGPTLQVFADGTGQFAAPVTLPDGHYVLVATQTVGGVTSAPAGTDGAIPFSVGSTVIVDPPVPPGRWVTTPEVPLCGTASPNATVRVQVRDLVTGAETWVTAVAGTQGKWCTTAHFEHDCHYELTPWIGTAPGKSVLVDVDMTAPKVTPQLPPDSNGWYNSGAVPVKLAIEDGKMGSGVTGVEISLDGGQTWAPYPTTGITVSGDGVHTIGWRATDKAGNTSAGSITIPIDTQAPQVIGAYNPDSGTVTLEPSDPVGGGGGGGSGVASLEVNTGNGWGPYTGPISGAVDIRWRCRDKAGNVRDGRISIPQLTANDQTGNEGEQKAFDLGAFADPGNGSPWTVRVDWGDGSAAETVTAAAAGPLGTRPHTYRDNGGFMVHVHVTNAAGYTGRGMFKITVANVAPTVSKIAAPNRPVLINTGVTASASFQDPGVLDSHRAIWDWGDGITSAGTVAETGGSGTVGGSHTYDHAGIYTVKLTIIDKDGGEGVSVYKHVVVYDPHGFAVGAGVFTSPKGAYTALPTRTGKVTFGFAAKYHGGASTPMGETAFEFKLASLNFHGTRNEWLVVTGQKAVYKGSGTINRKGDYGFLVAVIEAHSPGGSGPDKFRIKIWDKASGRVMYDNQPDADDDADPITRLDEGRIEVLQR